MTTPPTEPPQGDNPYGQPPQYGDPALPPGQSASYNPYGAPVYGQPPQPYQIGSTGPSKTMAGWALGLAIAFCVPFATLVSIGLAITVLVRSGNGRDYGRTMAIVALVIDVVLILGFAALIALAAFSDSDVDRDSSGQVTASQDASVFTILVGDCVNDDNIFGSADDEMTETTSVEVVPCSSSHQMEAFLTFDLPDGDYPSPDAISAMADQRCNMAFRDFVGRAAGRSELTFFFYLPSEDTWNVQDDRAVTCLVGGRDVETTGTLRGVDR